MGFRVGGGAVYLLFKHWRRKVKISAGLFSVGSLLFRSQKQEISPLKIRSCLRLPGVIRIQ